MSDTKSDTNPKTAFALRLPHDMVEEVSLRAEGLGISRNQWYENMTRWVLANTETIEKGNHGNHR